MLMDATMKLLALPVVLEASGPLGFAGVHMARGLGGVYLGVLPWGGIYLRESRLRRLIPLRLTT